MSDRHKISMAIHGGAGTITRQSMTPAQEKAYRSALDVALTIGYDLLAKGASALDAVEQAVTLAIQHAKKGSLIILSSDVVPDALNLVMKFKEEESNRLYEITKKDIPNLM